MARDAFKKFPIALAFLPGAAQAQAFRFTPLLQPELRLETAVSHAPAALAGAGFNLPAGYFVRIGPSISAGRVLSDSSANTLRADLVARFLTDPFRERNWGVYGGGGVSITWTDGMRAREALVLVAGVDFPGRSGWRPAIEAALGGGARVALVFRPARRLGR